MPDPEIPPLQPGDVWRDQRYQLKREAPRILGALLLVGVIAAIGPADAIRWALHAGG